MFDSSLNLWVVQPRLFSVCKLLLFFLKNQIIIKKTHVNRYLVKAKKKTNHSEQTMAIKLNRNVISVMHSSSSCIYSNSYSQLLAICSPKIFIFKYERIIAKIKYKYILYLVLPVRNTHLTKGNLHIQGRFTTIV